IRYRDEEPLAPETVAEVARRLFAQTGLPILIEPGRFLVGNAGILLTRCLYCKHSGGREFTVVDAGLSDLMRPSLYGAYHEIVLVKRSGTPNPAGPIPGASHGVGARVDIVGPLCESGDFLGLDRAVEGVAPGALLAVLDAGAYGFSMTSNYNSRPRPAEVMVYGDRWVTVRERERNEDMVRGERTLDEIEGVATWMETERP
ncbi:MAG: diaminopimelate decarboxylase family protein, partial [Gemmatimonadales bacterium]